VSPGSALGRGCLGGGRVRHRATARYPCAFSPRGRGIRVADDPDV